jgi:hypothetical protein
LSPFSEPALYRWQAKTPAAWRPCNAQKKNIDELQENLNRSFHRLRQGDIDEELFDVISVTRLSIMPPAWCNAQGKY